MKMHSTEREEAILQLVQTRGFVSFQELDRQFSASPATLRRDLDRLEEAGRIVRVRGGAKLAQASDGNLAVVPFDETIQHNRAAKRAIGRAAAGLCRPGESVIIDGGSTTFQMCPHLDGLGLNVLTNSLHIVSALLSQRGTRISVPAGTLFREQNILLSAFDDDGMARYRASRMFLGAASVGRHGLMQTDVILIQAERRLIQRADEIVVLVDSSKFEAPAGHMLCALSDVDTLITDAGLSAETRALLEDAGIRVIIAGD